MKNRQAFSKIVILILILASTMISCGPNTNEGNVQEAATQTAEANSQSETAPTDTPAPTSTSTPTTTPTETLEPTTAFLTNDEACQLIPEGLCYYPLFPAIEGYTQKFLVSNITTGEESYETRIYGATETNIQGAGEEQQDKFTYDLVTDAATTTIEAFCLADGILVNDIQAMAAISEDSMNYSDGSWETISLDINGFTYPRELSPGDTWTQTMEWVVDMDMAMINEFMLKSTTTFTYVGIETVEVPAGTFTAHRIDMVMDFVVGPMFNDSFMQFASIPVSGTSWNVDCLGPVKYAYNAMDEETISELVEYSLP
jgi:hypothetical protein